MRGNELRFGNLIFWDGELYDVKRSFFDQYSDDEIEPIPLTEEWLERFGFRKGHLFDTVLYLSSTNWHISSHNGIYQLNYKESPSEPWIPVCKDMKYVHQLQNLYFALTGEELTLKE